MTAAMGVLDPVRPAFRAAAVAVVPDARLLDARGWAEMEAIVHRVLAARPRRLGRQLRLLIRGLDWLSMMRWRRRLASLEPERRVALLESLQDAPLPPVRRGIWGLRALILMGYYGRPEAGPEIGYHPSLERWRRT